MSSGQSSTPRRYRAWSVATAVLLGLAALSSWIVDARLRESTERLEDNTGPVLIATQQAVAGLAEASDASNTVFLSADGDPEARRLYEDALARASARLEEVAAQIGDDPDAHEVLQMLGIMLNRYAAFVETARAELDDDAEEATAVHLAAVELLRTTGADGTEALIDATEQRFDDDMDMPTVSATLAVLAILGAGAVLIIAHVDLTRRTRRVLQPFLLAAFAITAVSGIWMTNAYLSARADLDEALDAGAESVSVTADLQVAGQRTRAEEAMGIIEDRAARFVAAEEAAADVDGLLDELLDNADSERERAGVEELLVRWERYRAAAAAVDAANGEEAVQLAIGPANAAFNGFNVTVEAVLGDNRADLIDNLDAAHDRTEWLWIAAGLPIVAAALALAGFQLRINEYR